MRLLGNQLDQPSLSKFGEQACRLLIAKDFSGLADTFGYALAYNRELASAIRADLDSCLSGRAYPPASIESVTVRNFKPNATGLVSLIECVLFFDKSVRVLAELIVAKNDESHELYLEDISLVAEHSSEANVG